VKADRGLTIERMVELGRVSRSGFYRFDSGSLPRPDDDMELRDAIHRIALEWPSYGRPRITAELRRQGWTVNHKRVRRLLREDTLLCLRKRKFVVTTDSNHGRKVYSNLAGKMTLTLFLSFCPCLISALLHLQFGVTHAEQDKTRLKLGPAHRLKNLLTRLDGHLTAFQIRKRFQRKQQQLIECPADLQRLRHIVQITVSRVRNGRTAKVPEVLGRGVRFDPKSKTRCRTGDNSTRD